MNSENKRRNEKSNRSRDNIVIVIILALIVITMILYIIQTNESSINNIIQSEEELIYKTAQSYINKKDYAKALAELEKVPQYKDTSSLILEMNYLAGVEEYATGNIGSSLVYFNKILNYKDSQDYVEKCNIIKKLVGSYRNEDKYIMINYEDTIYITRDDGYVEQLYYKMDFTKNTISIDSKGTKIKFDERSSSLTYKSKTYNKESDYIDESKIKYYTPKLGMTQEQVLNTSWGEPRNIDYGGTVVSKNNKKRTNDEWDESWYYKRNSNHIFIKFKHGKVVSFLVTLKGETAGKKVSSVDGL